MTNKHIGWLTLIAALGMLFTLEAVEISNLSSWNTALTPPFVGKFLAHLGTVIGAFIGGKLLPLDKE